MNDRPIKAALVMPVHNRRDTTLQALKSLARIDAKGLSIRIVVVDDGSTDGTTDAIRSKYPDVEIISGDGTLHYAAGTNRGIEAALKWDPDFVVAMNDDAVFHDQFLQRLIHAAKQNPRSIVGALLLLWNEPHRVFQIGQTWKTIKGGWVFPEGLTAFTMPVEAFEVEGIVGNCVLFPVEAIRELGLMDERKFPFGWGDAQYSARFRKNGWRLLVEPRSYVWCEPNTNPTPLHQRPFKERINVLFFDQRHPLNLKRQFDARWESAPSRIQAVAAFAVYLCQLGFKSVTSIFKSKSIPDAAVLHHL